MDGENPTKRQRLDFDKPRDRYQRMQPREQYNEVDSLKNKGIKEIQDIKNSINIRTDDSKTKQKVCIYWMQGNCRNSDQECPFLHANIEDRVSICKFYKEYGYCSKGDECLFRHVLPQDNPTPIAPNGSANEPCPYYERGFCHRGGECKFLQHELNMMMTLMNYQENMKGGINNLGSLFELCPNYIAGFCPKGPNCK